MLKTILFAGATSACLIAAAAAADLPSRRAPPVYVPPPVPVFSWTGAYIGANAGYAFTDNNALQTIGNDTVTQAQFAAGTVLQSARLHQSGVTAGGQIGYNFELPAGGLGAGGVVIGVEADAAYTDLRHSSTYVGAFEVTSQYKQRLDYLGTVRGRLGYAFDRFLVYGTGGFAYGHSSAGQDILAGNANNLLIWSGHGGSTQTGYAVGGGLEYALPTTSFLNPLSSSAVTLRAEYLYYDLGRHDVTLNGVAAAGTSFTDRYRTAGNIVRGAINYKFGSPAPAPVVARY